MSYDVPALAAMPNDLMAYQPYDLMTYPEDHLKAMMKWHGQHIQDSVERSNRADNPAIKVAEHRLRGFLENTRSEVERESIRRLVSKE